MPAALPTLAPDRHHSNQHPRTLLHLHLSHHRRGSLAASPWSRAAAAAAAAPVLIVMALRQAAAQAAILLRLSGRPAVTQSVLVPHSRRAISTTYFAASDEVRDGLHYANTHEWVKVEDGIGTIGITDHAQKALGDIVYVELPDEGTGVSAGERVSNVESVKAVSDINSPISGEVVEVNTTLNDNPETINASPYEDGWFIKVKLANDASLDKLMNAEKYSKYQDGE